MAVTDSPGAPLSVGREAGRGHYRGVPGHWDEAVADDGNVRPHWQPLFADTQLFDAAGAQGRQDLCRRLLKEYGVTYNLPGSSDQQQRPWQLDSWPLLISASEWQSLSLGVAQRARLLNQ